MILPSTFQSLVVQYFLSYGCFRRTPLGIGDSSRAQVMAERDSLLPGKRTGRDQSGLLRFTRMTSEGAFGFFPMELTGMQRKVLELQHQMPILHKQLAGRLEGLLAPSITCT